MYFFYSYGNDLTGRQKLMLSRDKGDFLERCPWTIKMGINWIQCTQVGSWHLRHAPTIYSQHISESKTEYMSVYTGGGSVCRTLSLNGFYFVNNIEMPRRSGAWGQKIRCNLFIQQGGIVNGVGKRDNITRNLENLTCDEYHELRPLKMILCSSPYAFRNRVCW